MCLGADCSCSGGVSTCCDGCQPLNEGGACDADANGCTVGDSCTAGVCTAGAAPDCSSEDDACNVGVCTSTGSDAYSCSKDPSSKEGDACDDGNALTGPDSCQSGVCLGADCSCSGVSTCCDGCQPLNEGGSCDADANGCTVGDSCTAGVCTAGAAPDCSSEDDACNVGVCTSTGSDAYSCSKDPSSKEGDACDDGNALTGPDSCQSGVCLGADCSCSGVSTCCDGCQPLNEGGSCDADANGCTVGDSCTAGVCTAGAAPDCSSEDDACNVGVCTSTGSDAYSCSKDPSSKEGDACDDGNACSTVDSCVSGSCTGEEFVECTQPEEECMEAVCNPDNGECFDQMTEDGTECNDGLSCVVNETCQSGECIGEEKGLRR